MLANVRPPSLASISGGGSEERRAVDRLAEHEDAVALLGRGDRLRDDDVAVEWGRDLDGRPVWAVDEPEAPDRLPGRDGVSRLEERLEEPVLARDDDRRRVAPVEDHGRGEAEGRAGLHLALQDADVAEDVPEAAPGEPVDGRRHTPAAAELGRDHELALVLRLDREQPVPVH